MNLQPSSRGLTKQDGDFLRVIASVSVVTAHCVHYWVERFCQAREWASLPFLCALFDQLTRFTVPLFLFLSGFGLALQFNQKPLVPANYYRFRLAKILGPFLVWSGLTAFRHMGYLQNLPWRHYPFSALQSLSKFLFLDGFDYQYYFLIVIFQFYLIFPFVYRLGRSHKWLGIFLAAHLLLLSPSETFLHLFGLEMPALHPNSLVYHWFYCFAGMFAAGNADFLMSVVTRWSKAGVVMFWLLAGALLNFEFLWNIQGDKSLNDVDHFNRWAVLVYCLASLLVFMKFKNWFRMNIYSHPRGKILFTHFAPYTFFVYLAHTHVLRIVDLLLWEVTVFDLINRIVLVLVGSYALAWFAQWLLEEFPRMRFLIGLPRNHAFQWDGVPGIRRLKLRRLSSESGFHASPRRVIMPRARGWKPDRFPPGREQGIRQPVNSQ